jgi:osmoprotectant transport system permease protein
MTDPRLADALARLPDYLGSHVLVSLTALAIGLSISLPLAILSTRRPLLRTIMLGVASVVQTIPGLALLTLFYPLLLALSALTERVLGVGFSALGFLPAVLALALYSMLPVLRNTVTGLNAISDGLRDAARALALTPGQSLRLVELPIAMPVIMAGIRTSAVWVIGTATLSTPIGQTSLGNYIFAGLQTQNWVFVLFGCVAAAALTLAVDQLLALIEHGVAAHSRGKIVAGGAGLALIVLAALLPGFGRAQAAIVVGAKPFTEQYVLTSLIEQRLAANDMPAARRDGLGSSVIFNALAANDVGIYVDYSGTIWANEMHRSDIKPRDEVLREVSQWLEATHHIRMLGTLGFENAYALAMPRALAAKLGVHSITDLAARAPNLSIGADYEFFERLEWKALGSAYGLHFRQQRTMQSDFMYRAAQSGEVQVVAAYSSDGRIAQYDLVVLDDPKHALPPYDAIFLLSPRYAHDEKLIAVLKPLIGVIPVDLMREANLRASSGASAQDAARWLDGEIAKAR